MTTDNTNPEWFIDEGIPGVGSRPSWLPEKFKTVAALAKSNAELEAKLGHVPDEYDFSKARNLESDYQPFAELKQVAKEKRVPMEVMDKLVDTFDKYIDKFKVNPDEELKKLGNNANERLTTLDNWAKANLSKESHAALSAIKTADAIKALEELRGKFMSSNTQVPTGNNGAVETGASLEDVKMELENNLDKYKTDVKYRDDLRRRLEIAAKNTPGFVDKVGA